MSSARQYRHSAAFALLALIALFVLLVVMYAQERGWLPKM